MKKISVLGSTGSIGTQALSVAREQGDIEIKALAAGTNAALMEKQVREFKPSLAVMYDADAAKDLKERLGDMSVRIETGMDGLLEVAAFPESEGVLGAVVGMIGIRPVIAAIEANKEIYLANKESLVCAGHIIMPLIKEKKIALLPVDSEHSAIFQSMQGFKKSEAEKILLTCSGGPFRGRKSDELTKVKAEDALKHPNWSMGRKITIDSATLVNKGLEVIEARWLFDMDYDNIQVLVHPQSVIHSAVAYRDGAVIAQMGVPSMRLPIQYAINYPQRRVLNEKRLDLFELGSLTFEKPDMETFRGLPLAYEAGKRGGSLPTVYNAANEKAVALFLDGKIGFAEIYDIIENCMSEHSVIDNPSLEEILKCEMDVYDNINSKY